MTRVITRDLPDTYFTDPEYQRQHSNTNIKYMLATDRKGNEIFVIWGPGLEAILHKEKFEYFGFSSVISAAYIGYDEDIGGWHCWGESTSLYVRARKQEDTAILREWIERGCTNE